MTIAGRPCRSTSFAATIPTTPGCQPSPATITTRPGGVASSFRQASSWTRSWTIRRRQVKGHPNGGEPLEGEAAARLVRVEHRVRVGLALGHLVVVDDDHLDPAAAGAGERLVVGGAAVAGDDQPAAVVSKAVGDLH